jgi:hypothetical protein
MCSEVYITFKQSLCNLLFLPSTLTRATEKMKLMYKDAALFGDKKFSLDFWILSFCVATLFGAIGHADARVSFQDDRDRTKS